MSLTSHLIKFFTLHPIFTLFLIDLLQAAVVGILLFLCLIEVPLLDLRVQNIPLLRCLAEEHGLLEVLELAHLFLECILVLLHEYRKR